MTNRPTACYDELTESRGKSAENSGDADCCRDAPIAEPLKSLCAYKPLKA